MEDIGTTREDTTVDTVPVDSGAGRQKLEQLLLGLDTGTAVTDLAALDLAIELLGFARSRQETPRLVGRVAEAVAGAVLGVHGRGSGAAVASAAVGIAGAAVGLGRGEADSAIGFRRSMAAQLVERRAAVGRRAQRR